MSPQHRQRGAAVVWIAVVVAVAALVINGVVPRLRRGDARTEATREATGPRRVVVVAPTVSSGPVTITLPGSANAFRVTGVYAKASGYVRKVHVDLGDRVKAGQLLAELEVPETDEELKRQRALLDAAEANAGLYEANAARTSSLNRVGVVSAQQAEQAREAANSAQAATKTSRAELQRLQALKAYERVSAPFAGVVSRRVVEPGQLVTLGTGSGPGSLLFEVADTGKLRVFFDVPQALAGDLKVGQRASVYLPSAPSQRIGGEVVRTSGALDPGTRTLRAEVDIDGRSGVLAGAFVNVELSIPRQTPMLIVPSAALAIRQEGPRVARLVGDRVKWVEVTLGRDLGREIEVTSGLSGEAERVVVNPPDDLADGEAVRATDRSLR